MSELAVKKEAETAVVPVQQQSALSPMVQAVMSGQMTPEQLQQLLDVQKNYEKNEAEKAFNMAVAEFKKNPPNVIKDKENKQFGSRYASKDSLVNTVNAAMSPFGLNARWIPDQKDGQVGVTCKLTHAQGHCETATLWAPPDKSGSKNPIQEIKSTLTYLEIATYEAVTGIAASDAGDDDGNGAGGPAYITDEQVANLECLISEVEADKALFLKYMKVSGLTIIPANQYDRAVRALEAKRAKA